MRRALKLGLSDVEMNILYALCMEGSGCYQSLLYKNTGLTRSTVNTVIRRFEKAELMYLKKRKRKEYLRVSYRKGRKLSEKHSTEDRGFGRIYFLKLDR